MSEKDSNQKKSEANNLQRRQLIVAGVVLSIIAITVGVWWWFHKHAESYKPAAGVRVEHSVPGVPQGLKIGVVVSYTEDAAEGSGWDGNGEGITIAKWRLTQGGTPVETVVVSDQGSAQGAIDAVKELTQARVSAIVALTRGSHTKELAAAASKSRLPIVFPYENAPQNPVSRAWYGVESTSVFTGLIGEQAEILGCSPLVSAGPAPNGLRVDGSATGKDLAKEVSDLLGKSKRGCVVVNGPGAQVAQQVQLLRTKGVNARIIVGTDGSNSVFTTAIAQQNPSGGMIYSIGNPTMVDGSPWVGFDQARSLAASDDNVVSLRGDDIAFAERSGLADAATYEAFMALVQASAQASSTEPNKVGKELESLRLEASQAVDGQARDFTSPVYQHGRLVQLVPMGAIWQWVDAK